MDTSFRLHPEQASTAAQEVDALYFYLLALSVFFTVLIAGLILAFAIRYRRGAKVRRGPVTQSLVLEVIWIAVPLVIVTFTFIWSVRLFFDMSRIPENALELHVVAKQWMWKFQHPQGRREIDTLHVPVGRAVKLTMISQDVIHSFFIPAFRTKQDVLPGRYSRTWFEATTPEEYHLFCAEYCGTSHSQMIGRVIVMSPADYQTWVAGDNPRETPMAAGERLYAALRCASCHGDANLGPTRGPSLVGIHGKTVALAGGGSARVDEDFLRESILRPGAKVMAGFEPIMPSFQGQVDEESLTELIAYLKSLNAQSTFTGAPER